MKPGLLIVWLLLLVSDALAHRLDEYLQAVRVAVATNRIDLAIDLTPGVAVIDQLLFVIDKDRNGLVSRMEEKDYADRFLQELRLHLDERGLTPSLVDVSFPTHPEIKRGLGVIRIKATVSIGQLAAGSHALTLTNAHLPAISVYLVNALVPKDDGIQITMQTRDECQRNYRLDFTVSR